MALPNTHFGGDNFSALLSHKCKIRFLGIGGVSMCSLARVAKLHGHDVSGYDRADSEITRALESDGIAVDHDERPESALAAELVVYTVAVAADNAEYTAALSHGIPTVSRADFLGFIMSGFKTRVGISGTHGKSTTTSMTAKIFTDAGADPTVNCGAVMSDLGASHREGATKEVFVFEACEYMDAFLDFYPTTAVVLNVEPDHLDYFKSMKQMRSSYTAFMEKTATLENGCAVVNADDSNAMAAAADFTGRVVTFAVDADADYRAVNIAADHSRAAFDVIYRGSFLFHASLKVPGRHCVCDALAATAAAMENGISAEVVCRSLAGFSGARRRMEFFGKTPAGADVYEDYAHHPTEITTTVTGADGMGCGTVWVVFQPHTYSRTAALYADFIEALSHAGRVVLADIYPARETDTLGMSSAKLARDIEGAVYFPSFAEIAAFVRDNAAAGDMVIVMGAGDVDSITPLLIQPD